MQKLTAFVASSFLPKDQPKVQTILTHLDTLKPLGFIWQSAESAESEPVSRKVQELIRAQDIFIGIMTVRHPVYSSIPHFVDGLKFWMGKLQPKGFSTSPWVLQECGFALAAGKKVILYIEPGVEHGGLQGDLEYIPFPYPDTADALLKTNEMISRLIAKKSGIVVETVVTELVAAPVEQEKVETTEAPELSAKAAESAVSSEPTPLGKAFLNMLNADLAENPKAADPFFEEGLKLIREAKDEVVSEVTWKTFYYARKLNMGDDEAFEALKELAIQNPNEELPSRYFGQALQKYEEPEQALKYFKIAMQAADASDKWRYVLYCAVCLMQLKQYGEAENLLNSGLDQTTLSSPESAAILSKLYDVLKQNDRKIEASGIAEYSLRTNPAQRNFRFDVGLDYHKGGLNDLSLHHFGLIVDHESTNSASLHNLALAYDQCSLPLLSVETYKKAIGHGGLLARNNLGQLYLKAGMSDEATALVDQIGDNKGELSTEVLSLLADIGEKRKKEEEQKDEIQVKAKAAKEFLASFGSAYLERPTAAIDGDWEFPFGIVSLERQGNAISGQRIQKKAFSGLQRMLLAGANSPPERTETITVVGRIKNQAAQIKISISTDVSTFYGDAGTSEKTFCLAFSLDGTSAKAAEMKDGKIEKISELSKVIGDIASSKL